MVTNRARSSQFSKSFQHIFGDVCSIESIAVEGDKNMSNAIYGLNILSKLNAEAHFWESRAHGMWRRGIWEVMRS